MFFFQHPLADFVTGANDLAFIDMLWRDWSPGFDGADAVTHVKESLGAPENLAAALGYYRATLGAGKRDPQLEDLQSRMGAEYPTQPLLYLHGVADGCIGAEVAQSAATMAPANVEVRLVDAAGHFLQLERVDTVATQIIDWLEKE
jgi:pimeloyl-ACP methyl ester carboxylesterase